MNMDMMCVYEEAGKENLYAAVHCRAYPFLTRPSVNQYRRTGKIPCRYGAE
jgi:hypothetical protein